MFAELAAIGSALSAINSTIATLKESKANAEDAARLLGKFGSASQKLDDWEKKKKLKKPLSPKEAMDLSIQRRKIKNTERQIKDTLLMSGLADVWHEAERIRRQSEIDHQNYLKDIHRKRKLRRQRIKRNSMAAFFIFSFFAITGGSFFIYKAIQKHRYQTAVERLEEVREQRRNMRRCGRIRC